ncbi:hypothetical protein [Synoicihabitans lomoniglobus]|uniref:hypothetical protein n=1 Tax=Synoicihabitans lomoniglobus TaxID=2909285 RepID=UPI002ED2641E|nr:hypothetical protein [Opitutaceae bacterium LMO-M01]
MDQLLNDVLRYSTRHPTARIDLLILPEVSVPHAWATFITRWAREHQIGVVCGLEHRIDRSGNAWNELLAALPYRAPNGTKACVPVLRLKRHYSPYETFVLDNNSLTVADRPNKSLYQLIQWRGASFALYNCYELTSLVDRSLFKARVDFIVASEYNPDVSYFSNIVESAARDLHCFVVQVNSADFGDSRVVSPAPTEKQKNSPLRIKGGDNQTFLTMELPLKRLRDHQRLGYGLQKDSKEFKPTPPDFSPTQVLRRINLGNS